MKTLTQADILEQPLPLKDVLVDSVYYPSSGFDANIIRDCNTTGRDLGVNSYVYCDYAIGETAFLERQDSFLGYEILASRRVQQPELIPNGWQMQLPPGIDSRTYTTWQNSWQPFAHWTVYNRKAEFGPEHGVAQFSLLYIGGEGVATYQALYWTNQIAPKVLAIIQPGDGFGLNWTRFAKPKQPLHWVVYHHPTSLPNSIYFGGYGSGYGDLGWDGYTAERLIRPYYGDGRGEVGVWKKNKS